MVTEFWAGGFLLGKAENLQGHSRPGNVVVVVWAFRKPEGAYRSLRALRDLSGLHSTPSSFAPGAILLSLPGTGVSDLLWVRGRALVRATAGLRQGGASMLRARDQVARAIDAKIKSEPFISAYSLAPVKRPDLSTFAGRLSSLRIPDNDLPGGLDTESWMVRAQPDARDRLHDDAAAQKLGRSFQALGLRGGATQVISVSQIHGNYVTYAWAFPTARGRAGGAAGGDAAGRRARRAGERRARRHARRPARHAAARRPLLGARQAAAPGRRLRAAGHSAAAVAPGARGAQARRTRVRAAMSWDSARAAERVARAYAAPDLAAVRERQIDLLGPQPGWRIADIGCGPGAFAAALVARGRAASPRSTPLARCSTPSRRGRSAASSSRPTRASLPLAAGSHDAACLVQVLEYVDDPVAALREAARVVRPGGVVLAADTDWDTQGFNVADRELGRRIVQAWADGKPDGWAGRRLRGWLTAAGLVPEDRCVVVLDATEWGGDTFIAHNWPYFRRGLEQSGRVSGRRSRALRGRDRGVGRERRVLLERRAPRLARARAGLTTCSLRREHLVEERGDDLDRLVRALEQVGVADVRELLQPREPGLELDDLTRREARLREHRRAEDVVGAVRHQDRALEASARAARDP